jgi:hypothetical protein
MHLQVDWPAPSYWIGEPALEGCQAALYCCWQPAPLVAGSWIGIALLALKIMNVQLAKQQLACTECQKYCPSTVSTVTR